MAATLVHKVLGDRLHCVFVDNGLLRYHVRGGGWGKGVFALPCKRQDCRGGEEDGCCATM